MKKLSKLSLLLAFLLIMSSLSSIVFAADAPVNLSVDDNVLKLDTPPQIIDGRTMVPLRGILEALGLELRWDPATKTVTASNKDYTIVLQIGSKTATVNGKEVTLDVPAQVTDTGRTMVPARFISESAGADVDWDAKSRTVNIKSENYSKTINNTTNISNVTGSTININNNNVDNSVVNSNNTTNNYDYSTKINNNINNTTTNTIIGNMDEILKQVGIQDGLKNSAMLDIQYTIVDKAENKPIKDAVLYVNGAATGVSDDMGVISFGVYGYATNLIKVAKDGYKDYQGSKTYTAKLTETISLEAGAGAVGSVKFADPNLEKAIRDALKKPDGDLAASDCSKIEGLFALGKQIKSLEGIQNLTNLISLNLDYNEISDLKPLSGLKNLKHLSIGTNKITDISPIGELTAIEELNAAGNGISDIQILDKLLNMKFLHLQGNNISDISVLTKLTGLVGLNLDGTKVIDLKPLSGLTNLDWLRVQVSGNVNITPVQGLKSLKRLYIDMHKSPDWSLVFNMPQLVELGIKDTTDAEIIQLAPLFTRLNTLYLESPKLNNYTMLFNFRALQRLGIKNAQSLPANFLFNLPNLPQLNFLELSGDSLSDISFIRNIPNLGTLLLDNNNITDITAIGNLSRLTWLSLKNNQISDVNALAKLTGLKSLFLEGNLIKDYSPLAPIYDNLKDKDFNVK